MTERFSGGCVCGGIRFTLTSRPMFVNACHCRDCQKQTGGPFVINALIETDRIDMLEGEPVCVPQPSPSGRGHDIYRCPKCQGAVWSDYGHRPALRFVRVAALDDPTAIEPDAHIFTRSKLPWVLLSPNTPAFEVFYDLKTQWPPESLARRRAILNDV